MKHVLVLGATSDIAQATIMEFAKNGYAFTLTARNSENLQDLKSDLEIRFDSEVNLCEFDATEFERHKDFYNRLPVKPDVVLLAFGYFFDEEHRTQVAFEEIHKLIQINYTGAVSILNIIANDLEKRGTGTIIGISSTAGDRGRWSNFWYGSAKAGVTAYLSGLRCRLSHANVHVLTVKPGIVHSKMTRDIDKPKPFAVNPDVAGKDIWQAFKKKKNILYTPWIWFWVLLVIRLLPEPVFKKTKL